MEPVSRRPRPSTFVDVWGITRWTCGVWIAYDHRIFRHRIFSRGSDTSVRCCHESRLDARGCLNRLQYVIGGNSIPVRRKET